MQDAAAVSKHMECLLQSVGKVKSQSEFFLSRIFFLTWQVHSVLDMKENFDIVFLKRFRKVISDTVHRINIFGFLFFKTLIIMRIHNVCFLFH